MLIDEKHFYSHTHTQTEGLTHQHRSRRNWVCSLHKPVFIQLVDGLQVLLKHTWRTVQPSSQSSSQHTKPSVPVEWLSPPFCIAASASHNRSEELSGGRLEPEETHTHTHTKLNIFPLISSMAWEEELEATGGQTHIRTSHQPRERLDSKPAQRS